MTVAAPRRAAIYRLFQCEDLGRFLASVEQSVASR